jgi:general secretion pathway protein M
MITADWMHDRRLRRAMFVALNLAAGFGMFALFIMPVDDLLSARDARIAEQRLLLARLTAIARREPAVQAAARETAEQLKRGELLIGPNEGVINADLQTRIKTITEQAGARLRSVQGLPAITSEQMRYVGARLDMHGSLQAIQRALHAIETGRPYLFVTSAAIRPSLNAQNPREEPVIEARLDVVGAMQVGERNP